MGKDEYSEGMIVADEEREKFFKLIKHPKPNPKFIGTDDGKKGLDLRFIPEAEDK